MRYGQDFCTLKGSDFRIVSRFFQGFLNPFGTCDYCGMGVVWARYVKSKRFHAAENEHLVPSMLYQKIPI